MQLTVKGRHIGTGDAFRRHAESSLSAVFDKYFGDAIDATVTLPREAHLFRAQISAHVGRGIELVASGEARQVDPAFDVAADHLSKRLRCHKRRLRDHGVARETAAQLAELPARMFRNRSRGGLNLVYRRTDGHVGWIDPRGNRATS